MENCIKPYKYEVEVDDREWAVGSTRAETKFAEEIQRCEAKLAEIKARVGGGRRLNGLVRYVDEVEKAEEERKRRRYSGTFKANEDGGATEGESASDDNVGDVYRYSPAQIVDGECRR